ncbi:MAG: DUF1573 domain-containing protein [Candidatus Vogelbacteria bacterium]|nr:DUF1573 domain-containing protein [Candidatus Vogelbacteria bacterium]
MTTKNSAFIGARAFIGIAVAILVLGGLIWVARPTAQSTPSTSARSNGTLAVEGSNNYDFGTVSMAAGKVKYNFIITNISSEAVTIEKMYTSCMCTTASLALAGQQFGPFGMPGHMAIPEINQTIKPGETASVEVVFDPAAHGPAGVGRTERTVTIENNVGQPVELQFVAVVTP